jgi:hypothetical protein
VRTIAPFRVRVVVDPSFGERLATLPADEPVWIIHSELNTPIAHKLWRERSAASYRTTFAACDEPDPEDQFLGQLDTIDLHHGHYSSSPPYSIIEVIGCPASDRVRAALDKKGFSIDVITAAGFVASSHAASRGADSRNHQLATREH